MAHMSIKSNRRITNNITLTELEYLDGATSSIQTQLNIKSNLESPTFTGTVTISGGATITGTTDVQELREQVVPITLTSNSATLDWTAGNIYYIATAPTGSMSFNLTNVPTDVNKMMTVNVIVTQGSTGYIPTTFQIGGVTQTIRWPAGTAPTPTSEAGKIDVFGFTLQRTAANEWIVYGSASANF